VNGNVKIRTGGVRRLAVANGPNIFQMLLVKSNYGFCASLSVVTPPLIEKQSIETSASVCLWSVRSHISKTTWPNFTKLSTHVARGRGSVLP